MGGFKSFWGFHAVHPWEIEEFALKAQVDFIDSTLAKSPRPLGERDRVRGATAGKITLTLALSPLGRG
jgi:hypothetical protein